jgi:pentalenene synthase
VSPDQTSNRPGHEITEYLLAGYVTEAVNRVRPTPPSFNEHLALRTDTIGVAPVLDMAERVGHYECPQRLLDSRPMQELRRIATEIVILDNDIVSVEKEEARGDLNLVLLHERETGMTRDLTIKAIADMVRMRSERFLSVEEQLPRLYGELNLDMDEQEAAERYSTDALQSLMRGAYDWDQKAGRYTQDFVTRVRFRLISPFPRDLKRAQLP